MRLNGLSSPLAAAVMLVTLCCAAARGDLLFTSYTGEALATNNSYTIGTEFTVGATPLTVTALGAYDSEQDGLANALQVGLWRVSDQQLIASATVPAGTGATLIDDWRFASLTSSVTLAAGTTYRIATFFGDDQAQLDDDPKNGSVTVHSSVTVTAGSVLRAGSYTYPSNTQTTNRYAANAVFFETLAPEPATLALLAIGALALRRRGA